MDYKSRFSAVSCRGAWRSGEPRGTEDLFLASGGRSDLRGRSFYGAGSPASAGLPAAMSAFLRIRSASPPGADLPGGVAEGPFLTQLGHWGSISKPA